jgi:hypothetical protein
MKFFNFKALIDQFTVTFTIEYPLTSDEPVLYDDLGKVVANEPLTPTFGKGALIPMSQRNIYQSGGRLTEADRQLYSLDHNIPNKSKITYKGLVYHVESKTPYEDYADFSTYTLKAVTAFD